MRSSSNPYLAETPRDRPALLEAGVFTTEPVRGLLGRWLHKRKLDKNRAVVESAPRPAPVSEDRRRRLDEARALVDEVLGAD